MVCSQYILWRLQCFGAIISIYLDTGYPEQGCGRCVCVGGGGAGGGCWNLSDLILDRRRTTSWSGHQSVTGYVKRWTMIHTVTEWQPIPRASQASVPLHHQWLLNDCPHEVYSQTWCFKKIVTNDASHQHARLDEMQIISSEGYSMLHDNRMVYSCVMEYYFLCWNRWPS